MIVRRGGNKKKAGVRSIVRRTRPTVGQKSGTIVRRQRSLPPPGGPSILRRAIAWRPGRGSALVAVLGAIAFVFGGIGYWAWTSTFFEVSNIRIEGAQRLDEAEVASSTGLFGQRMFTADLGEAQRTLYSMPLVERAEIHREWPDGIRITIVERQAWGTWVQDGLAYTIDRDGVVIDTPAPDGAIVIVSEEAGPVGLGQRVDYQAVDAAAEIFERLPRQLGTTVAEVRFLGMAGVQVTTADGQVGYLGDSGAMSYKLAAWAATAAEAERRGLEYTSIDLRHGNRPVLQ